MVEIMELPVTIAMDPWIISFVSNNLVFLALVLGLLKGLARLTPSVKDDSIVTLLEQALGAVPGFRAKGQANNNGQVKQTNKGG